MSEKGSRNDDKDAQLNPALRRTLKAFFGDESKIPGELRESLPREGGGFSVQRKRLINEALQAERNSDKNARDEALTLLDRRFGLPDDPPLLALALAHKSTSLQRRGLTRLVQSSLEELTSEERRSLISALRRFELHCFEDALLKQSQTLRQELLRAQSEEESGP